jgi:hypothetical protein
MRTAASLSTAHVRSGCLRASDVPAASLCTATLSSANVWASPVPPTALRSCSLWRRRSVGGTQERVGRGHRCHRSPVSTAGQNLLLGAEVLSAAMPSHGMCAPCMRSYLVRSGSTAHDAQGAETDAEQVIEGLVVSRDIVGGHCSDTVTR